MLIEENNRKNRIISAHDDLDPRADPVGFVPVKHYVKLEGSHTTWLLRNLLPVEGSLLLHAQEKMGKSALAIQLAIALSGGYKDWMGFEVMTHGRVLYLQVDNPRATWKERWRTLYECGFPLDNDRLRIADTKSLDVPSFNVGHPEHVRYLRTLVDEVAHDPLPPNAGWRGSPIAVIIDTLRDCHSADENSSTDLKNVLAALREATRPAALIVISHSKKKQKDTSSDILEGNRGSSAATAAVDAIIELNVPHKRNVGKLNYIGRDIEEGSVKIEKATIFRPDDDERMHGCLMWKVAEDELPNDNILKVLQDPHLAGIRGHGRALSILYQEAGVTKGDAAATMELRRYLSRNKAIVPDHKKYLIPDDS